MADYWITHTGSDGNAGTSQGEAFRSIKKALAAIGTGDTIKILADDTYTCGVQYNLTFSGQVILDGSDHWVQGFEYPVTGMENKTYFESSAVMGDGFAYRIVEVDETGSSSTRKVRLDRQMNTTGGTSGYIYDSHNSKEIVLSTGGNSQANTWVKLEGIADQTDKPVFHLTNNTNKRFLYINANNIHIYNIKFSAATYQNQIDTVVWASAASQRVTIIENCYFDKTHRDPGTNILGHVIYCTDANTICICINNEFTNTATTSIGGATAIELWQCSGIIYNNYIHDITLSSGQAKGISAVNSTRMVIVINNTIDTIHGNHNYGCDGIYPTGANGMYVANNTIYDVRNSGSGSSYGISSYFGGAPGSLLGAIHSNLICGNSGTNIDEGISIYNNTGSLGICDYNLIHDCTTSYGSNISGYFGDNDLSVDPYLTDIDNDDFTPKNILVCQGGLEGLNGEYQAIGAVHRRYKPVGANRV